MKSFFIKSSLVLIVLFISQSDITGQTGQFGDTPEDSIRCLRNLSLYSSHYRQGNYDAALPYWRLLMDEFPRSSRNIYIWGVDLMEHYIENAESEEEKRAYLDTAMMIFDQRIEYFGDEANVLNRKGLFYFSHNTNLEEAEVGYEALRKAIDLAGDSPSAAGITTYMNITAAKFRAGLIENEKVIETYTELTDLLDRVEESANLAQAREFIESIFADSGAADCEALTDIFGEQINQAPEDTELLNKVYDLLADTGCEDSELYLVITEKLHILDPSPRSALTLSAMYRDLNNNDEMINYLKQAIELQEDAKERGNYYLELAIISNDVKQDKVLSREYARKALQDNPNLGRAHMHIGNLYAAETNCFAGQEDADFKNRTVFWVAVDRFIRAREVDSSLSAQANRMIETYSVYFPDNETIFFHGLTEGDSYQVGCWINETTRVRPR